LVAPKMDFPFVPEIGIHIVVVGFS
jgi:hypothetical protein